MSTSLRETKRIRTMTGIQKAAVELFAENGFANTTVEEIAREADVGPATVYRHFETKEGIVLWDEYDSEFMEAMQTLIAAEGLAPALQALCVEVDEGMDEAARRRHRSRVRLVDSEPALRKQSVANGIAIAEMIASGLAMNAKRDEPSFEDNAIGHMIAGMFHSMMSDWAKQDPPGPSLRSLMRGTFAALRDKIPEEYF